MAPFRPEIQISDFAYQLPHEKIAQYPLPVRDQSKLLIWRNGEITDSSFANIHCFIPHGSLLVFNNTRVIHARLHFRLETGARIEIFCLEPYNPFDYQLSFSRKESVEWKCLVGNAKKWKHGKLYLEVTVKGKPTILSAEMTGREGNAFLIRFCWDNQATFAEIIEAAGQIPIPPYLNRPADTSDNERYQTIYAETDGSVAAPTAGLHFTPQVWQSLRNNSINSAGVTLHVGAGTFQPVKTNEVADHEMHTETIIISRQLVDNLLDTTRDIIAVGTTSVRTLESLYWLGATEEILQSSEKPHVGQWVPYQNRPGVSLNEALQRVGSFMELNSLPELTFTTSLIILPGYQFRVINGMLTNFHQPQSTLLLLVSAFLGDDWKKVYDYALNNNFRFLSYGDSNLYLRTT